MHAGSEAFRRLFATVAAATVVLASLSMSKPAYAQGGCSKDTDCKGTRVCEDGRCVEPPSAAAEPPPAPVPAPCQKDTDCGGDLVCENSVCVVAGSAPGEQDATAAPQQSEPEMAAAETEPPEPEYEEPPPQPDPAQVWIAGFWDWYNDQWLWRAGAWRTPPAGLAYVAPHYEIVRGKVAYTRGFWGSSKVKSRSYGGRVLKFKAAVRPPRYVKGAKVAVRPSPGLKVGKRPVAGYKWAGKPTHKFVIPPPKPKPVVRPVNIEHRQPPPGVRPVVTPTGTRATPRPLGLDSKEGTRCR
jgi:hypothetical protein